MKAADSIDIVNIVSGKRATLISGSGNNFKHQISGFFQQKGSLEKFDLNFTIARLNERSKYEHCWYKFTLEEDIINSLRRLGSLPISSIEETVQIMEENK